MRLVSGPLVRARSGETGKAQPVRIMIRPEAVRLGSRPEPGSILQGTISGVDYLGPSIRYTVAVGHDLVTVREFGKPDPPFAPGTEVSLTWEASAASVFPAADGEVEPR